MASVVQKIEVATMGGLNQLNYLAALVNHLNARLNDLLPAAADARRELTDTRQGILRYTLPCIRSLSPRVGSSGQQIVQSSVQIVDQGRQMVELIEPAHVVTTSIFWTTDVNLSTVPPSRLVTPHVAPRAFTPSRWSFSTDPVAGSTASRLPTAWAVRTWALPGAW